MLGKDFFELEHSKPLCNEYELLTVHNLHKYYCLLEMFKVNKFRTPTAIFTMFKRSTRRENYFIPPAPSPQFIYQSSSIWNNSRKANSEIDFSTPVNVFKSRLKKALLSIQKNYENEEWCTYNLDTSELVI